MHITTTWHGDNFNIDLSSAEGREPFLQIKGCRIVEGKNGPFISYPSRKLDSGKYWNHVYGSEKFNAAVLEKAQENKPGRASKRQQDDDGQVPF